jgi:hypothetical protein
MQCPCWEDRIPEHIYSQDLEELSRMQVLAMQLHSIEGQDILEGEKGASIRYIDSG